MSRKIITGNVLAIAVLLPAFVAGKIAGEADDVGKKVRVADDPPNEIKWTRGTVIEVKEDRHGEVKVKPDQPTKLRHLKTIWDKLDVVAFDVMPTYSDEWVPTNDLDYIND